MVTEMQVWNRMEEIRKKILKPGQYLRITYPAGIKNLKDAYRSATNPDQLIGVYRLEKLLYLVSEMEDLKNTTIITIL